LRVDFTAVSYLSPYQCTFYVYLNNVLVTLVNPIDYTVRKMEIVIKAKSGLNVLKFAGVMVFSGQGGGAGIDNV